MAGAEEGVRRWVGQSCPGWAHLPDTVGPGPEPEARQGAEGDGSADCQSTSDSSCPEPGQQAADTPRLWPHAHVGFRTWLSEPACGMEKTCSALGTPEVVFKFLGRQETVMNLLLSF